MPTSIRAHGRVRARGARKDYWRLLRERSHGGSVKWKVDYHPKKTLVFCQTVYTHPVQWTMVPMDQMTSWCRVQYSRYPIEYNTYKVAPQDASPV